MNSKKFKCYTNTPYVNWGGQLGQNVSKIIFYYYRSYFPRKEINPDHSARLSISSEITLKKNQQILLTTKHRSPQVDKVCFCSLDASSGIVTRHDVVVVSHRLPPAYPTILNRRQAAQTFVRRA